MSLSNIRPKTLLLIFKVTELSNQQTVKVRKKKTILEIEDSGALSEVSI